MVGGILGGVLNWEHMIAVRQPDSCTPDGRSFSSLGSREPRLVIRHNGGEEVFGEEVGPPWFLAWMLNLLGCRRGG